MGTPLFIGTILLHGRTKLFDSLGLNGSPLEGFVFALICTLPMFIGFAFLFDFNADISLNRIVLAVIAAGFFEELYFRGFLFGMLFRFSRLGYILSVLVGALLFGSVHIYQGSEFNQIVGIFMVTFMGGILFAWVYSEWNYNLWVPIFLHMLMNLSWELFSVSTNALGGSYSNIFRGITIALVIILTLRYKRKKGKALEVNKSTLIIKPKA